VIYLQFSRLAAILISEGYTFDMAYMHIQVWGEFAEWLWGPKGEISIDIYNIDKV
jgi:hypothetical protein